LIRVIYYNFLKIWVMRIYTLLFEKILL
jgi:hypothetical protein